MCRTPNGTQGDASFTGLETSAVIYRVRTRSRPRPRDKLGEGIPTTFPTGLLDERFPHWSDCLGSLGLDYRTGLGSGLECLGSLGTGVLGTTSLMVTGLDCLGSLGTCEGRLAGLATRLGWTMGVQPVYFHATTPIARLAKLL